MLEYQCNTIYYHFSFLKQTSLKIITIFAKNHKYEISYI